MFSVWRKPLHTFPLLNLVLLGLFLMGDAFFDIGEAGLIWYGYNSSVKVVKTVAPIR